MKTFKRSLILKGLLCLGLMATSCSNDDADNMDKESAETKFYITDAPTDNSNVSAVIVTIADLRVNNASVKNFTKTSIDLMQYQNGVKELLGDIKLETGTYSNIELVLDYQFDDSGNAPGCYVKLADGTKDAISATVSNITITDTFKVLPFETNTIVLDFDIRKSIVSNNNDFELVTTAELENSIRVVNQELTGEVSGVMTDSQNTSDMIIAYAYKAGTFNADVETQGQGTSEVMFSNAVTSSVVSNTTAKYELNFLPEGEYEIHFASYTDTDNDGEFEFNGRLEIESNSEITFNKIKVTSNSSLIISGSVKGIF